MPLGIWELYITQFCFLNISETLVVQVVPAICPMVCSKYFLHLFAVIAFNFSHYSDVSIFTCTWASYRSFGIHGGALLVLLNLVMLLIICRILLFMFALNSCIFSRVRLVEIIFSKAEIT